ncbi:MAG TPA: transposase [Acetobacteraceae bacterium]|nr:transposase [Acetobacteraceae bacterium]
MPEAARAMFAVLGTQIVAADRQLATQHAADPLSRRLAQVPGVGRITAQAVLTQVGPGQFASPRHFASWLGLTPQRNAAREASGGSAGSAGKAITGCASCSCSAPAR